MLTTSSSPQTATSPLPRWTLPTGAAPYATVPRFRVENSKSTRGFDEKIAFVEFLASQKAALTAALSDPLSDDQLTKANSLQKRFFFIVGGFPKLHSAISPAQKTLAALVDSFSLPSAACIEALYEQRALSLPDVLKIALAFEAAIKIGHQGANTYFGLSAGNPICPSNGKRIVPAFRSVDPKMLKKVRKSVGGSYQGFNEFLSKNGRSSVPMGFFDGWLELGYTAGNGHRAGNYLLTETTANLLHSYLASCNSSIVPTTVEALFPSDPDKFPGKGLYCSPLPVKHGNFLA